MLDELEQDTTGRTGVQEGNLVSPRPGAWLLVDQLDPAGPRPVERRLDVVCSGREVMHTRAVVVEVSPDWAVLAGLQQLDVAPAEIEKDRERPVDRLLVDPLAAKQVRVQRRKRVGISCCDADVVETRQTDTPGRCSPNTSRIVSHISPVVA